MLRTLTSRRVAPVALLAAATLLLAGCGDSGDKKSTDDSSSSPSASPSATETDGAQAATGKCQSYDAGEASNAVKVTGDFGKEQKATFTEPLEADDLERTLLTTGKGAATKAGQEVEVMVSGFLGSDGKALGTQTVPLTVGDTATIAAFSAGVECVPLGSRVVVAVPATQMYGPEGNADLGIKADDTIVLVTDVLRIKPELKPAAWTSQVPTVTFAKNGKPTLKLPAGKPATKLMLKVLRPGTGKVVQKGDSVTVDYQGTSWDDKKIFDQSYGKQPATFATDEVVQGFGAALVGQKVGTRLVVTIPPEYAYGAAGSGHELAGQTLVFVIEIKKTATS